MHSANNLLGGQRLARILAGAALALVLAAPGAAFGQQSGDAPANFNERYPAEPLPAPTPPTTAPAAAPATAPATPPANAPAQTPGSAATTQEPTGSTAPETVSRRERAVPTHEQAASQRTHRVTTREQGASSQQEAVETTGQVTRRKRSRIVVERRSFLDAGTEVRPGDRKFLDYAFPPLHQPMDVVTNTGGRTGWHNWPLPGPMFPTGPQN